jgi:hypothetical protein
LAEILFNDDSECWGLPWLAEKDPYFILFFFYNNRKDLPMLGTFLLDIQNKDEDPSSAFLHVESALKFDKNLNFYVNEYHSLVFLPNFKSPFPPELMGVKELKSVISKIISKLVRYCF